MPLFTREPFHVRMRDGRRLALKPPRGPRGLAQQHTPTRLRRASRTAVGVLLHQNWAGLHNQLRSLLSLAMLCTPCDTRFAAKTALPAIWKHRTGFATVSPRLSRSPDPFPARGALSHAASLPHARPQHARLSPSRPAHRRPVYARTAVRPPVGVCVNALLAVTERHDEWLRATPDDNPQRAPRRDGVCG